MQSDAIFKALAERHNHQVAEIQRKRDDLVRIQSGLFYPRCAIIVNIINFQKFERE